jgi:Transposase DDE domain group 1
VKRSGRLGKVKVTADGEGVVSHAGAELLREMAGFTGLIDAWDRALIGTYKAMPIHFPGTVLADLAVAIADGADSISDLKSLRDQPVLFGPVASTSTAWRVLDRVSEVHLSALRVGRATARAAAWVAGAAPDLSHELCLDIDATIVIAHSEKQLASPTWKHTFGFHPLLCFLDRTEISSGEALSGIVREGRAGSNTTADHISVLTMALAALPEAARPKKGDPEGPRLLVRADAAGATHGFAAFCRGEEVAFSFGFAIDKDVRKAIVLLERSAWVEATEEDDSVRDGAWVAEITDGLDLSAWPEGSRVIVRKERPHPGAQLSLFDEIEGLRHTAFICAERSAAETSALSLGRLEVRHRAHARVEDRIRQAKAAGLRNLPCKLAPEKVKSGRVV